MKRTRLAIVVSHPIQHFVHFYRAIAALEQLNVKVFFCSRLGLDRYFDRDMNTSIKWAGDMTAGFDHEFLPEAREIKTTGFRAINNPSLGAALNTFRPDAVLVYGYAQVTQLRALAWCRANRVPTLMMTDTNAVTKRQYLKKILRKSVLMPLLGRVSAFLTVGDQNEVALAAVGVPKAKMYRSPFTIDEKKYRQVFSERQEKRNKIRQLLDIPPSAFVGITVGKLIPRKCTQDAVEAFVLAAKKIGERRRIHLLICGDGPDREVIERLVEAGAPATLAGFINVDVLPDYFAAADVLIHAASRDAHPLICSEAASVGLPMIISDLVGCIGPTDIARRDENAMVYKCGDVTALASKIVQLANDDSQLRKMSESSKRIFEECDLEASVNGLLGALDAVTPSDMYTGEAR